ncbi:hypothetical protein [Enterobacter ludwigii]
MTHAIKQIVDTDGEPMMEVVVSSDCSAVDMEAIHAEALIENDEFDGIIRDGLTPEQRAIQTRREGMDIYGVRFAEMYAQDYAEALEMNEALDAEFARIDELAPDDNAKAIFKAIASKYEVGCVMGVNAAHAEAQEMNARHA